MSLGGHVCRLSRGELGRANVIVAIRQDKRRSVRMRALCSRGAPFECARSALNGARIHLCPAIRKHCGSAALGSLAATVNKLSVLCARTVNALQSVSASEQARASC